MGIVPVAKNDHGLGHNTPSWPALPQTQDPPTAESAWCRSVPWKKLPEAILKQCNLQTQNQVGEKWRVNWEGKIPRRVTSWPTLHDAKRWWEPRALRKHCIHQSLEVQRKTLVSDEQTQTSLRQNADTGRRISHIFSLLSRHKSDNRKNRCLIKSKRAL